MTQIQLLNGILGVAYVVAPLMTKSFFLKGSKLYSAFHGLALIGLAFALLEVRFVWCWPLFCLLGFGLYLKEEYRTVLTLSGLAKCIPFAFSLISAMWFVAGNNNLQLLGYDEAWSLYAAIHGAFIGWMFVGCLAFLSGRKNGGIYLWGCYLTFALFLLVAFGINGVPHIKPIGVVGLALLVPLTIAHYGLHLPPAMRTSRILAMTSLIAIVASMVLAVLYEFTDSLSGVVFDLPIMVISHGVLNAIVVVPCFFLAIRNES